MVVFERSYACQWLLLNGATQATSQTAGVSTKPLHAITVTHDDKKEAD
jgi:hypothetical protein